MGRGLLAGDRYDSITLLWPWCVEPSSGQRSCKFAAESALKEWTPNPKLCEIQHINCTQKIFGSIFICCGFKHLFFYIYLSPNCIQSHLQTSASPFLATTICNQMKQMASTSGVGPQVHFKWLGTIFPHQLGFWKSSWGKKRILKRLDFLTLDLVSTPPALLLSRWSLSVRESPGPLMVWCGLTASSSVSRPW